MAQQDLLTAIVLLYFIGEGSCLHQRASSIAHWASEKVSPEKRGGEERQRVQASRLFAARSDAWLIWAQELSRDRQDDARGVDAIGTTEDETVTRESEFLPDMSVAGRRDFVQYHGQKLHSNGHLVASCYSESHTFWKSHNHSTLQFMKVWRALRPGGFVYSLEENDSCLMYDGFVDAMPVSIKKGKGKEDDDELNPWLGFQVLALIKRSFDTICEDEADSFQWVEPMTFPVAGPLQKNGRVRNYAVVWPENNTCTKSHPCPLVIFLSGIGEHSPSVAHPNKKEMRASFQTLHKFGYLRYWDRDRGCASTLGSVLLFPELSRLENWVKDGPNLFEHFIVPLINEVRRPHPLRIDGQHLALMGYSEGAFGAMHGAALYPHVFSYAIAASASMSKEWWRDMRPIWTRPSQKLLKAWKLDLVMLAFGELDNTGNQSYNLEQCMKYLDAAHVASYTTVQVRYYAGLYHKEVWDRLFNRWPLFHRVFWEGSFHESQDLSLKWHAYQELLAMEESMIPHIRALPLPT